MKSIDDNLLAAYLEGRLNEEDAKTVEEIIESDPELLDFVAEWVALNETMLSLPKEEEEAVATGEHVKTLLPFVRPVARVASRPAARAASDYDHMPTLAPSCEQTRSAAGSSRPKWQKILIAASVLAFISIPMIMLIRHQQQEELPCVPIEREIGNPTHIGEYDNPRGNNDRALGSSVADTIDGLDTIPGDDPIELTDK